MIGKTNVKKVLAWIASAIVAFASFIFAESWLIASPKILGLPGAILAVGLICTGMAWFATFVLTSSRANESLQGWITNKEKELSKKLEKYVRYGKIIMTILVDLTLGTEFVVILLFTFNVKGKKLYLLSVIYGFLFSTFWCSIYAGAWWGLMKAFHFVVNHWKGVGL